MFKLIILCILFVPPISTAWSDTYGEQANEDATKPLDDQLGACVKSGSYSFQGGNGNLPPKPGAEARSAYIKIKRFPCPNAPKSSS